MRRLVITGAALALLLSACGGGDDAVEDSSTTTGPTSTTAFDADATAGTDDSSTTTTGDAAYDPARFVITDADHGAVLRVHPGDSIRVRLHVADPSGPLWILANEPDLGLVEFGDSLLWMPSEPGAEPSHFELVIWIRGTGETDIIFSLGPLTPTTRTVAFSIESVDP